MPATSKIWLLEDGGIPKEMNGSKGSNGDGTGKPRCRLNTKTALRAVLSPLPHPPHQGEGKERCLGNRIVIGVSRQVFYTLRPSVVGHKAILPRLDSCRVETGRHPSQLSTESGGGLFNLLRKEVLQDVITPIPRTFHYSITLKNFL